MSFTFDTTIPNAPNNPSVDQPGMLQNNVSTNGILAVDHITFNLLGGGQHKQVTFNGKNVPGAQTDPQSTLYTNNVTATGTNTASASTVASAFFRNQNAIYPVSMIRAFGAFDSGGTSLNTWNMSATRVSAGKFNISLATNAVTGFNYAVLLTNTGGGAFTFLDQDYSINNITGQINVQFGRQGISFNDPNQFSILVLQL